MTFLQHARMVASVSALAVGLWSAPALAQVSDDVADGDRAFEAGDYKKAAKNYDKAIKKSPREVSPGVYGKRAAIYIVQKQYEAGLEFIETRAERAHPGAPEILEYKAAIMWEIGRKGDAIKVADRVAQQREESFVAQKIRGDWYFQRDPEKAADAYEKYLKYRTEELKDQDAMPRVRLGFLYLRLERYKDAVDQLELVMRRFRKNARAQVNAANGLCAAYAATAQWNRCITVCESIVEDPRRIDRTGSAYYHLGVAYLRQNQPRRARQAGFEFIKFQRSKAKGYELIGDAYFQEGLWDEALRHYKDADDRKKGDPGIAMKMGKTYRRMGRSREAIAQLEVAAQANPDSVELGIELGISYLEEREDDKAITRAEVVLGSGAEMSDTSRAELHFISARGHYNKGQMPAAKAAFLAAHQLRPNETKYTNGLVDTLVRQAHHAFFSKNFGDAEKLLVEAYGYNKRAPMTNQNLAVIYLHQGKCDQAQEYLGALRKARQNGMITHRLTARAYLCQSKPDVEKAIKYYESAERQAQKAKNNQMRAEIYTEWAPLMIQKAPNDRKTLDDAIEKLETAVQFSGQNPGIREPAERNLALALYRRGWMHYRDGKSAEAVEDFEKATRNPGLLKGTEQLAFEFSLALALLDKGDSEEAARIFKDLAKKGNQNRYLKAPYDRVGAEFFGAFADYRTSDLGARRRAVSVFQRMYGPAKGAFKNTLRDLLASGWSWIAYTEYTTNKESAAARSLATADRLGGSDRVIEHNRAVLGMGRTPNPGTFEAMKGVPVEALFNLGVAYDRLGKPRDAYEAWVEFKRRGGRHGKLDDYLGAKKRIYGY